MARTWTCIQAIASSGPGKRLVIGSKLRNLGVDGDDVSELDFAPRRRRRYRARMLERISEFMRHEARLLAALSDLARAKQEEPTDVDGGRRYCALCGWSVEGDDHRSAERMIRHFRLGHRTGLPPVKRRLRRAPIFASASPNMIECLRCPWAIAGEDLAGLAQSMEQHWRAAHGGEA